ncbi:MAG: hypothetical protein CVV64_00365 [Candidatus Wallbacteria bacterium HGW-Wallbacteria-1]|jgi:hypothetical protein|uniref:Prepilin-type N-terminal cleavage/methylation domain-containing protein n=1 Tax=Candidatus Wallbacteria bacterium HGW-Wallbacteria-1 TaxID=2013854 RepID=A0A2N1PU80_9BACT|nr:MAG: hypothetical protein CVV64_00365 [Candidatus Wallbacteria bacterium HGW-Wallbacteria-1]
MKHSYIGRCLRIRIGSRGLTIVELLIAFSIVSLMMTTVWQVFSHVMNAFQNVTIVELDRRVRLVFEWIRNDVRKACTRGSVLPGSPIGTKYYKFIVEDPDTSNFGMPIDLFGQRDYIHGRTLRFFKFSQQPSPVSPPVATMVKFTFAQQNIGGELMDCVIRQETDETFSVSSRVIAKFPHNSEDPSKNAFLYFVLFSVDEVTPELIKAGMARPEELATGGRTFVRIYFRAVNTTGRETETVELVTVVDPRQINNFEKETNWKQNSLSKVRIMADLLPSQGS